MPKLADHPVLVTKRTKDAVVDFSSLLSFKLGRHVTYGEVVALAMQALAEQEAAR